MMKKLVGSSVAFSLAFGMWLVACGGNNDATTSGGGGTIAAGGSGGGSGQSTWDEAMCRQRYSECFGANWERDIPLSTPCYTEVAEVAGACQCGDTPCMSQVTGQMVPLSLTCLGCITAFMQCSPRFFPNIEFCRGGRSGGSGGSPSGGGGTATSSGGTTTSSGGTTTSSGGTTTSSGGTTTSSGGKPGTGGVLGTGGTGTSTGGTSGGSTRQCAPKTATTPAITSTGGLSCPGALCTEGTYAGYLYVYSDGTSTICAGPDSLCASGTTGVADTAGKIWGAGVGINLDKAEPPADVQLSGTGMTYALSSLPTQGLRAQVTVGGKDYCVKLASASGTVAWTDFNTACWDNSGTKLTGAPKTAHLGFQVTAATAAGTFDFCVTKVSF
jgi:hypothetical protein